MPYFHHNGHRLHYQVTGAGAPLLLHHGFTSSLESWRYFGFVESLKAHFTVISFDALGHGKSDKPHNTDAYTLDHRCDDVLALLDTLHLPQVHYMGYSLGGWVGYGLAQQAPERLSSFIVGGAHPHADPSWSAFHAIDGHDANAFIAAFETVLNDTIDAPTRMFIKGNDVIALAASAQQPRTSLADVLPHITMPALLFCGDQDQRHQQVEETARQLPQGRFVSLPDITHFGGVMHSALVLPAVMDFMQEHFPEREKK